MWDKDKPPYLKIKLSIKTVHTLCGKHSGPDISHMPP
jgi:hypothetical protein